MDELKVTVDADRATATVTEVQALVAADAPDLPLYVAPNVLGIADRVKGFNYFGDISVDLAFDPDSKLTSYVERMAP